MSISYTGKCETCGHAESAHKTLTGVCKHVDKCHAYKPVIDIEAHNTTDGKPPIELYKFQTDYLRGLPSKYIFAADTGTGKSFMALAHYDKQAYLKPLLIIAPASKVGTGDWERDIKHYFAGRIVPEYEIYSYEKFSRVPSVAQYKKTGERGIWRNWLNRYPAGFAVISDEIHKAKNPQSKMGKAVYEIAQSADFFVGLSATPLPNGWIDAMNYFKMFGLTKNKTAFKKRYVNETTVKGFPEILGYYREEELQRNWNNIAKPLNKDKALDLPSLVAVPVSLPAGTEYGKVLKQRMFEDRFLDNPSALLHALRQSITEPKIKWLDEFLEGVSDNVVIFYNYKSERNKILDMIKRNHKGRQVIRQDGEKHEVPSKENWNSLHRTITLAQYQSGSTGIELTYAATTVYFSPTYSYSNYEQSIGRTNRNGQTKKMTLYLLCAPGTLEKDVWNALRNKSDFQESQWYAKRLEAGEVQGGYLLMQQLSRTAANKRVRELEKLLSAQSRAMHDALQYAIEDMMLDAGTQEVRADEYIGALRCLKRATKHFDRLTTNFPKDSKLSYWGYGIYSPYDNLYSRVVHRNKLTEI